MIRMHWWLWNIQTISNVSSAIVIIWVDNIISFMNLNLNDKNALMIVKYSNHKQCKQCHCHHLGRSAGWSLLPLTPVANIIIFLISVNIFLSLTPVNNIIILLNSVNTFLSMIISNLNCRLFCDKSERSSWRWGGCHWESRLVNYQNRYEHREMSKGMS